TARVRGHGEVPERPKLAGSDSLLRVLPRRQRRRHWGVAPDRLEPGRRGADPTLREPPRRTLPRSRQGWIPESRTRAVAPSSRAARASGSAGHEDVAAQPSQVRLRASQRGAMLVAAAVVLSASAAVPGANPDSNAAIPVPLVVGASREAISALSRIEDSIS